MDVDDHSRQRAFPGFDSYRGRYLYLSVLFSLGLAIAAGYGFWQVDHLEQRQLKRYQTRAQAVGSLREVQHQLSGAESLLYRFLLIPNETAQHRLSAATGRLLTGFEQLRETLAETTFETIENPVPAVLEDARRLRWAVSELLAMRQQTDLWIPATSQMELLRGETTQGIAAIDALLDQLRTARTDRTRSALATSAIALRHYWLSAVAEVRLLIVNRFNVFEHDALLGLHSRESNIRQYIDVANNHLGQMIAVADSGRIEFEADNLVRTANHHFGHWQREFDKFSEEIIRDDWRRDLAHLNKRISPLLVSLHQRLEAIRLELEVQSAQDISEVTGIAEALSRVMWVLVAVGVLVAILGYIAFSHLLLKPMRDTALALRQEATGQQLTVEISSPVTETRDLVDAFEELRRQVHSREARLDYMAHHDNLTDLPNRSLFNDRLYHACELSKRDDMPLGIMFLDLDRFKQINDSLGHQVGDEILIETAARLTQQVRASDTVARLGGDEFAILMERVRRPEEFEIIAEKVLNAIGKPYFIGEHELHLSTSIGIAVCPTDSSDPEELLRHADTAMYEAKRRGKARFHFFSAELGSLASRQIVIEAALRRALANGEFVLHLQPVYAHSDRSPYAYEALLRWQHPERGLVPPGDFLDVLVDSGLIVQVTHWILDEVDRLGRILDGVDSPKIAVNLSANLLRSSAFTDNLIDRLQHNRPSPERLIIEITEDSLGEHIGEASSALRQLRELGVRIALDDFGTGQSSLGHLRRFPFDILKIDREFVRDVHSDGNDANLVAAIIRMATALGMDVVAVGVETRAQLEFVRAEGCRYVQGYLLGKPEPAQQWFGPNAVESDRA